MTANQARDAAQRCREAAADFRVSRDAYDALGMPEMVRIYTKLAAVMEDGARRLRAIERQGEE